MPSFLGTGEFLPQILHSCADGQMKGQTCLGMFRIWKENLYILQFVSARSKGFEKKHLNNDTL